MRAFPALAALALLTLLTGAAHAAADCAPVSALPTYEAEHEPDGRSYDAVVLRVQRGASIEEERVAGETCIQHYAPIAGTDPMSDTDIQGEVRAQLREGGSEILFSDERMTVARRVEGGEETWVRIVSQETAIDVTTVARKAHVQVLTAPGANDYAPIGHMPDYVADAPDRRAFDQRPFTVREGEDTREVVVQGARIEIDYALREGGRLASDLDIQENYRMALMGAGATVLFTDERNTVARFDRGGRTTWFRVWSQETAINVTIIEEMPHRLTLLPPSGVDSRLLGHMPDYVADPPQRRTLDELILAVPDGEETREIKVQGARLDITYALRAGATPASDLDIQMNYRAALEALGAQILLAEADTTVARLMDGDRLVWVKVWSQETTISLFFVKETAFKAAIKPTPAEALKTALETRGRVGLHVAYDFNRATLRPQAGPILAEVARLLRETPSLRLVIEGHTDNIGGRGANIALAAARANTVRDTLAAAGIDPARLTPTGIGAGRPIADNTTSEGRARNRRIVLVRQ